MSDPTAHQQQPMPQPPAQPAPLPSTTHQPWMQPVVDARTPTGRRAPTRILGIQPVLLVGIALLTLVTLLTIVLIFVGDIGSQAPRVVWTVIAFGAFTGLLALDLALAQRSSVPLVIGVAANIYLLAILMLATWVDMRRAEPVDLYDSFDDDALPIGVRLLGVYLLAFVVVRAGAAAAWALVSLGRRGALPVARVTGVVAASLIGLAAVLLTMHLAISPFGIEIGDLYWRVAVAAVVLSALAACVTTLLFWNRRHLEPRPQRPDEATQQGAAPQHWPAPQQPQAWPIHAETQQQPQQPWPGQPGQPWPGQPLQGQPGQPWQGAPPSGPPVPQRDPSAEGAVPNPMQPPYQQRGPQDPA